jgi:hypothetical protein
MNTLSKDETEPRITPSQIYVTRAIKEILKSQRCWMLFQDTTTTTTIAMATIMTNAIHHIFGCCWKCNLTFGSYTKRNMIASVMASCTIKIEDTFLQ